MQIHTIHLGIPTNWHPLFWPLTWKTPPIFQQPPAVEAWLSELSLNLNTCDVSNFHRGIDGKTARFLSKAVVYKWYYHKWINYRGHSITNPNNALLDNYKEIPPKKISHIFAFLDPPNMGHSLTPELLREVGTICHQEYQLPQVSPFPLVLQTLVHWSSPSNPSTWMQIGRRDAPQGVVEPENPWLIRIEVKKMPIHGHLFESRETTLRSQWLYLENAWKQC